MSLIRIRIGRAWVGFEGLGKGIEDLCLSLGSGMWRSQGVGQQLWLFRVRYGGVKSDFVTESGVNLIRMAWEWVRFEAYM